MARTLTSTPSSGVYEVLRALYRARAHNGNKVAAKRLRRYLPTHTNLTDITTILDSEAGGTHVAKTGSTYGLTDAGVTYARAHPPAKGRIPVY